MSLRNAVSAALLRALPPGTRRFAAFQLIRDAAAHRAPVGDLLTDAPIGNSDARFRRWLADRPLERAGRPPRNVVVQAGEWTVPDARDDDFVIFARPGDRFEPGALAIIGVAAADTATDLLYWDDALIDFDGSLGSPRFRPDWSPELLLAAPYLHRSFAIRRRRLGPAGQVIEDLWDLLLRCDFDAADVTHLPLLLEGLIDRDDRGDPAVATAALQRAGMEGTMTPSGALVWTPQAWPRVSLVIPTRHNRTQLEQLFPALEATSYSDFEIVVIDNGGRTDANEAWYGEWSERLDLEVEWWESDFNYSAVNNLGARSATGEVLVFLNDDAVPLHPSWLENLVGWLQLPEVGVVGALLLSSSGRVDHAGIVAGMHSLAGHMLRTCRPDEVTIFGPVNWPRNVLAVTGACAAVRRDTFDEIGGFDEAFQLTGSDVALGATAVRAGYRNVCTPWSRLRHDERSTRGASDPEGDIELTVAALADWIEAGDPWYSPNLSLRSPRPELRSHGEIRR